MYSQVLVFLTGQTPHALCLGCSDTCAVSANSVPLLWCCSFSEVKLSTQRCLSDVPPCCLFPLLCSLASCCSSASARGPWWALSLSGFPALVCWPMASCSLGHIDTLPRLYLHPCPQLCPLPIFPYSPSLTQPHLFTFLLLNSNLLSCLLFASPHTFLFVLLPLTCPSANLVHAAAAFT